MNINPYLRHLAFVLGLFSLLAVGPASAATVYISNWGANQILTSTSFGNAGYTTVFANSVDGLAGPSGMILDSSGNVYVTNYTNGKIVKFDSSGNVALTINTGVVSPIPIAVDSFGNIYTASNSPGSSIVQFNSAGVFQGNFISLGTTQAHGLAFDPAGNLYVADEPNSQILKYNSAGVLLGVFANSSDGINQPNGITYHGGSLYVTNGAGGGTGSVMKFDALGNLIFTTSGDSGALQYPYGVAVDGSGNIFATSFNGNSMLQYNSTGAYVQTFTGYSNPVSIVIQSVPEPSTFGLTLLGAGMLLRGVFRRRVA